MNGGTCIDGVDDFTCSCPPQLTGLLCECLILDEEDQGAEGGSNLNCNYTRNDSTTDQMDTTTAHATTLGGDNYKTTEATTIAGQEVETVTVDNGNEPMTMPLPTTTTTYPITTDGPSGLSTTNNAYPSTTTDAVGGEQVATTTTTTTAINTPPITITTSDMVDTTPSSGDHQVTTIKFSTGALPSTSEDTVGVGDYGSESDKFTTILFPAEQTTGISVEQTTTDEQDSSGPFKPTTERGETSTTDADDKTKATITEPTIFKTITTATGLPTGHTTTVANGSDGEETMSQTGYPHPDFFTDSPQLSPTGDTTTMTTEAATTTPTSTEQSTRPFDGTIRNFTLGLDCQRMPCLNSGTCVMTSAGAQVSLTGGCICS